MQDKPRATILTLPGKVFWPALSGFLFLPPGGAAFGAAVGAASWWIEATDSR